jgi:hypothetical protein
VQGYLSKAFAGSFEDQGSLLRLRRCEGWILRRRIPGTDYCDAMGLYQLFACPRWDRLSEDLDALEGSLVSLVAVPDPFGQHDLKLLRSAFGNIVVPFKEHLTIDARKPLSVSQHHRYYARRAHKAIAIDQVEPAATFASEFAPAYDNLVQLRNLSGIKALSPKALRLQLAVPGAIAFRARSDGEVVGGQIWYIADEVAYSHLTAVTKRGYSLRASYAIYDAAIETLRTRVRWFDLGGAAGAEARADGGLASFKKGWSNDRRTAYLCGRILDPRVYARLAPPYCPGAYFPEYRAGELAPISRHA